MGWEQTAVYQLRINNVDIFSVSFVRRMLELLAFISAALGLLGAFAALATGNLLIAGGTFFGGLVSAAFIMAVVHVIDLLDRIARSLAVVTGQLDDIVNRDQSASGTERSGASSDLIASR
ncbi:MAG TPA: hypothetical protein VD978_27635 [Azospirillum sp.]|nr:hypothetical protein [Azospirillum sp.]